MTLNGIPTLEGRGGYRCVGVGKPAFAFLNPESLPRSLKDLLTILERIDSAGGKFRSLTEAIDTSGPAGRNADARLLR
jgi:hypothetical protein